MQGLALGSGQALSQPTYQVRVHHPVESGINPGRYLKGRVPGTLGGGDVLSSHFMSMSSISPFPNNNEESTIFLTHSYYMFMLLK